MGLVLTPKASISTHFVANEIVVQKVYTAFNSHVVDDARRRRSKGYNTHAEYVVELHLVTYGPSQVVLLPLI